MEDKGGRGEEKIEGSRRKRGSERKMKTRIKMGREGVKGG